MHSLLHCGKYNGAKLHGEKQFQQMCKKGKIYTDDCFTYYPYGSNIAKVKKVIGYYQSESYFELYRDQIKKELHVRKKEPSDKKKKKLKNCSNVMRFAFTYGGEIMCQMKKTEH